MKTGIIAAALIVVFAIPTLAGSGAYYIGLRLGSVSCTIMTHEPSPKRYKNVGKIYAKG